MWAIGVGEKPGVNQPGRVRSVDGLRALAFMLVFLFHSWEFSGRPRIPVLTDIISQNTRPDLFVVITGFALFLPFAIDQTRYDRFKVGVYLERRAKRIVLPYYAALALALVLPYLLKVLYNLTGRTASPTEPVAWGDLLSHLTFTHMFFPEYWAGINGSLWTMSLEMQLYLLFPILVLAMARWGVWVLLGAAAISIGWHLLGPLFVSNTFPENFLWGATGIGRLVEFGAGMLAAVIVMRHRDKLTRVPLLIAALLVVLGYAVAVSVRFSGALEWFPVREIGLSISFCALIVLAIGAAPVEAVFATPLVSRVGYMAYSFFLVHQPIVYYFSELLKRGLGMSDGLVLLAILWTVGLALVFVVGYVLYVLVEEPCIRWSKAAGRRAARSTS